MVTRHWQPGKTQDLNTVSGYSQLISSGELKTNNFLIDVTLSDSVGRMVQLGRPSALDLINHCDLMALVSDKPTQTCTD